MKKWKRWTWATGVVLAAIAATTAIVVLRPDMRTSMSAANPASAAASAVVPVRIGVAVGVTGVNSVVAPTVVQSSQLAVDEINREGGILGRPVNLVIADDGSDPSGVPAAAKTLMDRDHVDVVIAMETSAARSAMLPLIERAHVPYIYTSFYEGHACSPWMYANGWVPEQQVVPIAQYLMQDKAAHTFYLIGSDYAFGRGILGYVRKYVESHGGRIVGDDYQKIGDNDWTSIIARVRSARPDALISATTGGEPNLSLARQLDAAGQKMPYGNLAIDENTARVLGQRATGMLLSASYLTSIDSRENSEFLSHMLIRFGAALQPPNELSVPQYEAIHLYKLAAERAGTTDSNKVLAALADVTFDGPRGLVRMNSSRHAALSMRLGRIQTDGSVRVLKTFGNTDPGAQCPGV